LGLGSQKNTAKKTNFMLFFASVPAWLAKNSASGGAVFSH
jgi:hypothetical protein